MRIAFLLLTAVAAFAADEPCQPKEKPLPCYVRVLQDKLASYRKSVEAQMQSERDMSSALAEVLATEAERNVYEILQLERFDASFKLASDLAEDRLTPAQMRERIREIAMKEFQAARQFHEAEMTALTTVLPSLKRNELDAKKLDALNQALTQLAAKPELKTQLADMLAFAKEYQSVYDLETCKDLARSASITTGSLSTLRAQLAESQIEPDAKSDLENKIKILDARLADTAKIRDRHPRFDKTTSRCK